MAKNTNIKSETSFINKLAKNLLLLVDISKNVYNNNINNSSNNKRVKRSPLSKKLSKLIK